MAKWNKNGIGEGSTTRTCSYCHITQTVNVYNGEVTFKYCPYCGSTMVNAEVDDDMTSKELHVKRIVPARQEVSLLEEKYQKLYRKECAEKAGVKVATCDNCAYSCVITCSDHNDCLGGHCTCCHDFCYKWMPDNSVSAYLREYHHYDEFAVFNLQKLLGDDVLKCDRLDLVLKSLELMDEIKEKATEKRYEQRKKEYDND